MENNEDAFLALFIDIMKDAMPDKVIANFVFVAEIVSNQNSELSVVTSNGMTPWLAQGMIRAAEDMIVSGVDSILDSGEEDDE